MIDQLVKEILEILEEMRTENPEIKCSKCKFKQGCRLLNFVNQIGQKYGVEKYDDRFNCSEFKREVNGIKH